MTERRPCPAAPGPLEAYAAKFDPRLGTLAQRRGFRECLQGLLLPSRSQQNADRIGWCRWHDPAHSDDWTPVERQFRDGHAQTWYAADLTLSGYGPDRLVRLVVATTDPAALPAISPGT